MSPDVQKQANKGAKNHAVIMPDANPEATASALIGASMGAAGQRCMAISAAVFVGGIGKYKDALISKAKALKVTAGHEPGCDVGPVISRESKKRVEDLIQSATQQVGAHGLCQCNQGFDPLCVCTPMTHVALQ